MSGVARVVSQVAGVVASVTAFIPGLQPIAIVAAAVSAVSGAVAAATAPKPPGARGTISEVVIGANMPVPYAMGRTYIGGMMVFDGSASESAGDRYPNKFRTQIFVYSAAGPIEEFQSLQADYTAITINGSSGGLLGPGAASGFYGGSEPHLWMNSRKGQRPDTALSAPSGVNFPSGWTSASKLSGFAAASLTMKFDEDGKRWASGLPAFGVVGKWVWAYDPRLDSTYPGGSGTHDWDDESTWAWTENPGLHALTYARGRFMGASNVRVVGAGIPQAAIEIADFVELANLCDANGWTVGGVIYEGPGISKWDNLKRILDTAAAEPLWVGGKLRLKITAPKVALDTIGAEDLIEGEVAIPAMSAWKGKFNTGVARYRSEAHRWEYVQAEAVSNSTYVTEDGETKTQEIQFDLIQDKDQAAQRMAYWLANNREYGPIRLPCKPRLRLYRPGEALNIDLADILGDAGLGTQLAVITRRTLDPATGSVMLELESETDAKHAWALGQTGVAPPTPTIIPPEDVDETVAEQNLTDAQVSQLIQSSTVEGLTFTVDVSTMEVTISNHTRKYPDKPAVSVTGDTLSIPAGTANPDVVAVTYDDPARAGGAVSYTLHVLETGDELPANSADNPFLHSVLVAVVPATGSTGGGSAVGSGGGAGGGGGGWGGSNPDIYG